MSGFDDLLAEIQGTGWFQKRLVYFLMGPLFFLMPFAFLNQIFVLHIPGEYTIIRHFEGFLDLLWDFFGTFLGLFWSLIGII